MTNMPVTHDASGLIESAFRGSDKAKSGRAWLRAAVADPDLLVVLAFCAIGLLVTLDLMFRFQDLVPNFADIARFLS
jgi:hypothetical protein